METQPILKANAADTEPELNALDSRSVRRRKSLKLRGHARVADKPSFLRRLVSSGVYRKKIIGTLLVYFNYFAFSWLYGTVGPSLPDLQDIVAVDLKAASWIFTCFSLGYMAGCALHGFLYGHVNNVLLLALYASSSGLFWIATPWCKYYWLMLVVRFLGGAGWGCTDSGAHSQLFAIWGAEAGPFSELLYLTLGLGGMASTFAIKPFLETTVDDGSSSDSSQNTSLTTPLPETTWTIFETSLYNNVTTVPGIEVTTPGTPYPTTSVQWAYLIAGSVSLLSSIPLFVDYFRDKCCGDENHEAIEDHTVHASAKSSGRSRAVFITAMLLLSLIVLIMTGLIDTYAGFVTTFTLRQMNWSKQDSAFAATVFYIAFAVGNLVCMLLSLVLHTGTLLMSSLIGGTLSLAGLTVCGILRLDVGIWACDVACGFFMSPFWPAFFTYVEESVIPVAGKVASAFLFLGAAGMALNPLIVGYTMGALSPLWFTYVMLAECAIMAVLFAVVLFLYRKSSNTYTSI